MDEGMVGGQTGNTCHPLRQARNTLYDSRVTFYSGCLICPSHSSIHLGMMMGHSSHSRQCTGGKSGRKQTCKLWVCKQILLFRCMHAHTRMQARQGYEQCNYINPWYDWKHEVLDCRPFTCPNRLYLLKYTLQCNTLLLHYHKAHIYTHIHSELGPGVVHHPSDRWWCYAFLCWAEASLWIGVSRVQGLVTFCFIVLGLENGFYSKGEDEIRLCQEYRPLCLYPHCWRLIAAQRTSFPSPPRSVLYRFSPLPLSLHLALSFLLWLSCSLTLPAHPQFHPSSLCRH